MKDRRPANPPVSPAPVRRRPYATPVLVLHGSVRQVTFGSKGGKFDGGATRVRGSDPLAKRDIVQVGTHPLGIGLYLYRYRPEFTALFGTDRHFGVMADEVERVLPQAVARHACGIRAVDYEMLGIRDIGQRLDS
jgi:hypothetical protein